MVTSLFPANTPRTKNSKHIIKKKKTSPTHSKINRQINKQRQKMGDCVETQVTVIV